MTIEYPPFVPLDQLGAYLAGKSTEQSLREAEALYDAERTRAHWDNLQEARAAHKLAIDQR